jgi:hypothetical protein
MEEGLLVFALPAEFSELLVRFDCCRTVASLGANLGQKTFIQELL